MQKVINVLALVSFAASASVVGAGAYVYINKDALIEQVKKEAMASVGEMVAGQLGATLFSGPSDGADLPDPSILDETGSVGLPVIPFGM
jgi:hypothetical protein